MTRLIIAGATGQTGGAAFAAAGADHTFDVIGGLAGPGEEDIARKIFSSFDDISDADVLVDFTIPDVAASVIPAAAARGMAVVSGTTGLTDQQEKVINEAAKTVPIVRSGNFSLGVNMLLALVQQAASKLEGYDIEVTEAHHRRKIDSPSGTALMLGEAAAQGINATLHERGVFTRHGQVGPRKKGEIGFSVIRGGGVPGDHTVGFYSDHEVVEISHRAMDRRLFAEGALHAAKWVKSQKPGLYTMRDVLGLDG